ncbi:GIP, partial [Symbiodinium necroappetens]
TVFGWPANTTDPRAAEPEEQDVDAVQVTDQVDATSSFICYADGEPEAAYVTGLTTAEAVKNGMAVIDGGATRTLASVPAMEAIMSINHKKRGHNGVSSVDLGDRPVFGFGNGSENQCASTVLLKIAANKVPGALKVHCLDQGSGPLLLSVESLRKLGAIVDFEEDMICFRKLDAHKIVQVERSTTGHQLISMTEDIMSKAKLVLAVPLMALNLNKLNHMTKEQLRNYLYEEFNEHAYHKWTKVDIRQRLLELHNVNVEDLHRGTDLTTTQAAIREVRKAAKKKADLVKLCEETYHMTVNRNDTVAILEARVLKIIYDSKEPESGDAIGFGKHSYLQYVDMLDPEHENYAKWVMTTARENPTTGCDPRLYRLARWLETQNLDGRQAKTRGIPASATPKRMSKGYMSTPGARMSPGAASSSSEHVEAQDRKIEALTEVLAEIKSELKEIKGEKMRKQGSRAGPDAEMAESSQSDASFFKIGTPPPSRTTPQ